MCSGQSQLRESAELVVNFYLPARELKLKPAAANAAVGDPRPASGTVGLFPRLVRHVRVGPDLGRYTGEKLADSKNTVITKLLSDTDLGSKVQTDEVLKQVTGEYLRTFTAKGVCELKVCKRDA